MSGGYSSYSELGTIIKQKINDISCAKLEKRHLDHGEGPYRIIRVKHPVFILWNPAKAGNMACVRFYGVPLLPAGLL